MIVVGDSTVFIYFAVVGELNSLQVLAPIIVPEAVYNEVYSEGNYKPGSQEFHNAVKEGWIKVRKYSDSEFYDKLKYLHDGEREALTVAKELLADCIILDDEDAIMAYHIWLKPLNVRYLSSFGVCKLLWEKGFTKINHLEMRLKINQANTLIRRF